MKIGEIIGAIGGLGCAIMLVVVLSIGGVFAGWAWKYYTADIRGRIEANETIKSGPNRIAQYEHFFNLCAAIQGNEAQIDSLTENLAVAVDNDDRARIQASIAGVKAIRLTGIAQYNADASKSYTSGQFLASNLPYQIPATAYPQGGRTTCAA